jgi:hypothetical protein
MGLQTHEEESHPTGLHRWQADCHPCGVNALPTNGQARAGRVDAAALFVAWYNFGRSHITLKTTPAAVAGLASEAWTMERLLSESAKGSQSKSAALGPGYVQVALCRTICLCLGSGL